MPNVFQYFPGLPAALLAGAGIALSLAVGVGWLALLLKTRARLADTEEQCAKLDETCRSRKS